MTKPVPHDQENPSALLYFAHHHHAAPLLHEGLLSSCAAFAASLALWKHSSSLVPLSICSGERIRQEAMGGLLTKCSQLVVVRLILGIGQEEVLCIQRRFRHLACRLHPVKAYLHLKQQVRTTSEYRKFV